MSVMSNTIIHVDNLYKEYKLGVINHGTLTHDLQSWWAKIRGKDDPNSVISREHNADAEKNSFLALKDINFEVKAGDRVGIIGKNGAGKSTLLKILSKITTPTKGRVKIKGRVGSLLEVGTGFHPELTGRENIYLNGAILGMSKKEIDQKFDEIVDFAGVERHIDTPVKRYSSGMNVRLGFAVAAHLEPEILIVDEVLAVGDAEFQKKAIGKMEDVSRGEGRTILFVSHNMGAIQLLCSRSLLLERGMIRAAGNTDEVTRVYLDDIIIANSTSLIERRDREGTGLLKFSLVRFYDSDGNVRSTLISGKDVIIEFVFERNTQDFLSNVNFAIGIDNGNMDRITFISNNMINMTIKDMPVGCTTIKLKIKKLPLVAGKYSFTLYMQINGIVADWIINAASFYVEEGDYYQSGKIFPSGQGYFQMDYSFYLENDK